MAIKAIKRQSEYKYIPLEERGEKKPTTFYFKPLDKETKARLEDKLVTVNKDETINISNATYILEAFRICVVKVENFVDEKNREVPIVRGKDGLVVYDFLDMLPDSIIQEVGQTIINISKFPDKADLFLGE